MAVYKPYKKTSSGKEEIKIPYSSIDGTPTIPTVNNGTLTIQKNGTTVKTFSANQSTAVTANITVPTKVSELTNDSGFTSNAGTITGIKMNGASKGTSGVVDLGTVITDISGKANLSGGNTFSGTQVITGYLDIRGTAAEKHLKTRGIGGSDGNGNSNDLYLQYSSDYKTYFGKTAQSSLNSDGSISINGKTAATTDQIPTVNNGTLTIKKNGTSVGTFTANQSGNVTANITFHLYEHNIELSCSKATSTAAPSRAYVYFTVITTSATAWDWNTLISPNYFGGTGTYLNAGGYGYIADPEGNSRSYNASVQTIFFGSSHIVVEMVYNNSFLGIDNEHSGAFFYSNNVTITDKVRTIL